MAHCQNCNSLLNIKEEEYGEGVCFPCMKGNREEDEEDEE